MVAEWIKIIDIQAAFVRSLKTFAHLQVENLESQSLRLLDLLGSGGNLDLEIRHLTKKRSTQASLFKLKRPLNLGHSQPSWISFSSIRPLRFSFGKKGPHAFFYIFGLQKLS